MNQQVETQHRLLASAVHNNAAWCDAVCTAHGKPGEFSQHIWLQKHGSPRFYPDAATLTKEGRHRQEEHIAELARQRPGGLAVKDSYRSLDLGKLGFKMLFDADWIGMAPRPASNKLTPAWQQAECEDDLYRWELAWSDSDRITETGRVFPDTLLSAPEICFLLATEDGTLVGGGILNHAAGAVGISNVFSRGMPVQAVWEGLIATAAARFPGLPLVGYESGEDLPAALSAGFDVIGQLRVWLRS